MEIFEVDLSTNIEDVENDFYNGIYENVLINTDKDWIDEEILQKNIEFLIKEMKKEK